MVHNGQSKKKNCQYCVKQLIFSETLHRPVFKTLTNFLYIFLQDLTDKIGKILDLQDVDKGLDDYRSTSYLTFEQYRYYLFKEVFSALPDEMSIPDQHR